VIFIDDEVQSGFCRAGKWFAVEHWDLTRDVLNLGKALGGDFPVAAVVGLKRVWVSYLQHRSLLPLLEML